MLERPEGDDSDSEEADRGPLHKRRRRFRRKLERDEPLRVDYSSRTGTHFCRACEAENSAGAKRCANCSAALTGPDQASFDAAMRAERAVASEPDPVPEVVEATPEIAPEAMVPADRKSVV